MKITRGFMLLELIIAIGIGALLMGLLFGALFQVQQQAQRVDETVELYSRFAVVQAQWDRDIQGVFVATTPSPSAKADASAIAEPAKPEAQPTVSPPSESAGAQEKTSQLSHIFYSEQAGDNLKLLTFITANPVQVYWSDAVGGPRPRIARVVYRLEPDKEHKNSYMLTRQESYTLEFEAFNNKEAIRPFVLCHNIKTLKVTYLAKKVDDKGGKEKTSPPPPPTYEVVKEWNSTTAEHQRAEFIEQQGKQKPGGPAPQAKEEPLIEIPQRVDMSLCLWSGNGRREKTLDFSVMILAQPFAKASPDAQKESSDKKEEKKPSDVKEGAAKPEAAKGSLTIGIAPGGAPGATPPVPASVPIGGGVK